MQHQQPQHLTSSDSFANLKKCLRGMLAGAMLATLAACGPGDETPPEPPKAAPSLVAQPVVIAAIPNTAITSFAEVDYGALLPADTSTQSTTPILYGSIGGTLSSGQKVNIYDGDTLLPDVANVYLGTSWSFKPSTPLSIGTHSFTAAVSDADGTTGTHSAPFVITIVPPPIPTLVLGISPPAALAGTPTTFTVTGQKLPLTAELRIVTASCDTPTNRSETGFTAVCTPPAATNASLAYLIYSNTQAAEGSPIGVMGAINISTDPAAVAAEIAAAAAATSTPTPTPAPSAAVK